MSAPPPLPSSHGHLTHVHLLGPSSRLSSSLVCFRGMDHRPPTWHLAQVCPNMGHLLKEINKLINK